MLNGFELAVSVDEGERAILAVAAGEWSRGQFVDWVRAYLTPIREGNEDPIS